MCYLILDRNANTRLLVGVGNGFLSTSVYTVEIVKAELRGSFSVFEGVARSLGIICMYILGTFIFWHQIAYVGLVFPLIALMLLCILSQESPVYLVSKENLEEAENSLRRLNDDSKDVMKDLKDILENIQKHEKESNIYNKEFIINIHHRPDIYKPFLIVTFIR